MKHKSKIDPFDPTGFLYQANIHGWEGYNDTKEAKEITEKYKWHNCQHGQYFFVPWHRMYVYNFEKILRIAANDETLTFPYWDYFDIDQRSIPEPFRVPADNISNSLFVNERCPEMNGGKPLPFEIINHNPALYSPFFTVNKFSNPEHVCHSLGGAETNKPEFESDGFGVLEQMPHNQIHLFIGGFMADNCRASQDPIFWLHHVQIDRIYESWLKNGGKTPSDSKWLDQTFELFDETGGVKTYKVRDILDTEKDLNYKYDKLININIEDKQKSAKLPVLNIIVDEMNMNELKVNKNKPYIIIPLDIKAKQMFNQISKDPIDEIKYRFSIQFSIEYIKRGVIFDIYMNLPKETRPYAEGPYYVRPLVVLQPGCNEELKNLSIHNCYDVSSNLQLILKHEINYNGHISNSMNITFVPRSCVGNIQINGPEEWIRFNRIQLVEIVVDSDKSLSLKIKPYLLFQAFFSLGLLLLHIIK